MEIKSVYLLIFYNGSETWINARILGSNERRHQKNESIPRFTFCPSMWPSSHISPLASIPTNFLIKSFSFEFSEVQGKPLQSSFRELLCTSVVIFEMLWPLFTRTFNKSQMCATPMPDFPWFLPVPFPYAKSISEAATSTFKPCLRPAPSSPIPLPKCKLLCPAQATCQHSDWPPQLPPSWPLLPQLHVGWACSISPASPPSFPRSLCYDLGLLSVSNTHPTLSHCKALHVLFSAPHHLSFSMVGPEPSA